MPRTGNLNQRISDYSRCPCCVSEQRLGYANAYFNAAEQLFGVCKRHAVKWYISRALLHPAIPDLTEFPHLVAAFDYTEPCVSTIVDRRSAPDTHSALRKPGVEPRPRSYLLYAVPSTARVPIEAVADG